MKIKILSYTNPLDDKFESVNALIYTINDRFFTFNAELEEIEEFTYKLDDHPEEDVVGFNELYSKLQAYLSRTTSILISARREKANWQRLLSEANGFYKRVRSSFFAHRDDIQKLKNKELQEAQVEEAIPDLVDARRRAEDKIEELESIIEIFEEKRDELDKANTNLSRQQKAV